MIRLEKITATDINFITSIQPLDWPSITDAYLFYLQSAFCTPYKLIDANRIMGIGNIIFFETSAWLSQIIVPEDFRGKGFGRLLIESLIAQIRSPFDSINLLATDQGYPVYLKLGFQEVSTYNFYKYNLEKPLIYNHQQFHAYQNSFYDEIVALDTLMSGENRRHLYSDDVLKSMELYFDNQNKLIGLSAPALGDGLLIALDERLGINMINQRLMSKQKIAFPMDNSTALEYMQSLNLNYYRQAVRMTLGKKLDTLLQFLYSRIGGNLG